MNVIDRPSLEDALRALDRGREAAIESASSVALAILDDGGNAIAAERMDGARPYAAKLAAQKALSAVKVNLDTRSIRALFARGAELDGLDAVFHGILVLLPGGFPVRHHGALVAAVGVDGAGDELDERVARIVVAALEERA